MDTKTPVSTEEAPPPYSAAPPTSQSPAPPSSCSKSQSDSLSSHLQSHLSALPDRIRRNQQWQSVREAEGDIQILDHLAPIVEAFLADLGAQRSLPPLATLTLVPHGAVPANAVLSSLDPMLQRGEVGRVFRVDMRPPGDGKGGKGRSNYDGGASSSSALQTISDRSAETGHREFTDWGRWEEPGSSSSGAAAGGPDPLAWWRDEDLARRLASYLQPREEETGGKSSSSNTNNNARPNPVQAAVEQRLPAEKPRRSWGWGRRKNGEPSPSSSSPSPSSPAASTTTVTLPPPGEPFSEAAARPGTVASGDVAGVPSGGHQLGNGRRARMTVSAQEVAFRHENDFGIWESTSGWAVVVAVKMDS